jgi:hypothetical protein
MIRVFLVAALGLRAGPAHEAPRINAGGVVPNPRVGYRQPLKPGIEVSIYARYLGPETACSAGAWGASDVKELCATAVMVGGVPAALLYVQEKQINLRVPSNVPTDGCRS